MLICVHFETNIIIMSMRILPHILNQFNKKINYTLRLYSSATLENNCISFREKEWFASQEKYKNYENVFYSSYLELQKNVQNKPNTQRKTKSETIMSAKNWMEDYEYYVGSNHQENQSTNILGKSDDTIAASTIPCSGCGAYLHCHQHNKPGFLPVEIFKGRTNEELKTLTCQRCHFLQHYNTALDVEVTPQLYVDILSRIKDKFALALILVDLLDFPSSIWAGLHEILGPKRPIFIVGNKVDLLPRDCNGYLEHIKHCLKEEIIKVGFNTLNIKHISLISARTGYGIEELINQLHKKWSYKGDVYLIGCTNVGKSSLFNILLNSDLCRPQASQLIRKATTCPWPGTTLEMLKFPIHRPSSIRLLRRCKRLIAQRVVKAEENKLRQLKARRYGQISDAEPVSDVGQTFIRDISNENNDPFSMNLGTRPIITLNENCKDYQEARWVYDTPGVMNPAQFTHLLTTEELSLMYPRQMITPRAFRLEVGMSLFVGGLARLDFLRCESKDLKWLQVFLFASPNLSTLIADTKYADTVYEKYLNTPLLNIPFDDKHRFQKWPSLQTNYEEFKVKGCKLNSKHKEMPCSADITLSSVGWAGVLAPLNVECVLQAWTPHGKGIYLRTPSLIPYASRIIGKRIRNSLAYNTAKPFVFKK